jgi:hypothetical protein
VITRGVRVGGMAFGNGVLMRAGRHWAWARDDGALLHGAVPARFGDRRWTRLPLVRSLIGFADMLALSVRLHRRNGPRRAGRLLLWLAVLVAVSMLAGPLVYAHVRPPLLADAVMQALGLLLALVVLRLGWAPRSGATTAPSTRRSMRTRAAPTSRTPRPSAPSAVSTTAAAPIWS